ncbi:MAG: heme ABC exporter ATP-binding protein CcmA [Rhodobacteraceae bacterium]|nr:heme ABC exporter ATP-binding protein CcmA [Paracoccaceae bacterium]
MPDAIDTDPEKALFKLDFEFCQTGWPVQDLEVLARNITCRRGDRLLLSELSFSARSGECLVFTGGNGIGKSTLLQHLAGILQLHTGTLSVPAGQSVFLGHENGLKNALTVIDNLRFWAGIFEQYEIDSISREFDVLHLHDFRTGLLSSGQLRRVALASVAVSKRKIWLLDEPTSGLGADSVELFTQAAARHCGTGGIIVASTHARFQGMDCHYLDLAEFVPELRGGPV